MKIEPCDYCDFIGPFVRDEQPVRDAHRVLHDFGRFWQRAFGPLMDAFSGIGHAAQDAEERFPALRAAIDDADDTARREAVDMASIKAGDLVTLVRDEHLARDVVERIDVYPSPQGGFSIVLRERTQTYLTSAGWLVTEHHSALPPLIEGQWYDADTEDEQNLCLQWSPIDGFRANHPWLVPGSDGTRYRTDYVTTYRTIEEPK